VMPLAGDLRSKEPDSAYLQRKMQKIWKH